MVLTELQIYGWEPSESSSLPTLSAAPMQVIDFRVPLLPKHPSASSFGMFGSPILLLSPTYLTLAIRHQCKKGDEASQQLQQQLCDVMLFDLNHPTAKASHSFLRPAPVQMPIEKLKHISLPFVADLRLVVRGMDSGAPFPASKRSSSTYLLALEQKALVSYVQAAKGAESSKASTGGTGVAETPQATQTQDTARESNGASPPEDSPSPPPIASIEPAPSPPTLSNGIDASCPAISTDAPLIPKREPTAMPVPLPGETQLGSATTAAVLDTCVNPGDRRVATQEPGSAEAGRAPIDLSVVAEQGDETAFQQTYREIYSGANQQTKLVLAEFSDVDGSFQRAIHSEVSAILNRLVSEAARQEGQRAEQYLANLRNTGAALRNAIEGTGTSQPSVNLVLDNLEKRLTSLVKTGLRDMVPQLIELIYQGASAGPASWSTALDKGIDDVLQSAGVTLMHELGKLDASQLLKDSKGEGRLAYDVEETSDATATSVKTVLAALEASFREDFTKQCHERLIPCVVAYVNEPTASIQKKLNEIVRGNVEMLCREMIDKARETARPALTLPERISFDSDATALECRTNPQQRADDIRRGRGDASDNEKGLVGEADRLESLISFTQSLHSTMSSASQQAAPPPAPFSSSSRDIGAQITQLMQRCQYTLAFERVALFCLKADGSRQQGNDDALTALCREIEKCTPESFYDELASAAPADDPLDMRSPVYHCVTVPLMLAGHLLGLAQSILSQQGATSGTRKTEGMAAAEASQASLIELLLRWICVGVQRINLKQMLTGQVSDSPDKATKLLDNITQCTRDIVVFLRRFEDALGQYQQADPQSNQRILSRLSSWAQSARGLLINLEEVTPELLVS